MSLILFLIFLKMKKTTKYLFYVIAWVGAVISFSSCEQDEPMDSPFVGPEEQAESTILIYSVATNSLRYNLVYDKKEMLEAAQYIDLDRHNVLIFQTSYRIDEENNVFTNEGEVSLIKLVKEEEEYGWETVKEYSMDVASLNPTRINEVVDYVITNFPADTYGLMFWSHSTGSQPYLTGRDMAENAPATYSFGQDLTTNDQKYVQINVDELAEALPDNLFKFIWFDSCYMSNIESIYQLRNKCDYYIGYPTEVLDDGNPYQIVLPYLTSLDPDVLGAAHAFFNYYDFEYYVRIATIALMDMSKIELLADFCNKIYTQQTLQSISNLHKYTRGSTGPFYDLGDYTKAMALLDEAEVSNDEWKELLDECLLYRNATPYDFSGRAIDPVRYSGISTHVYNFESNSDAEKYYRSLDWYKRVFFKDSEDVEDNPDEENNDSTITENIE